MASTDDSAAFAPFQTLGYALKRAQYAMRRHMDYQLKDLGLSAPQYAVLASLETEPGASNAQLARRSFTTPQTMQVMLVKMQQAGLIERVPDETHGRIRRTLLTSKGRKVLDAAHLVAAQSEQIARKVASADDIAMLHRLAEMLD